MKKSEIMYLKLKTFASTCYFLLVFTVMVFYVQDKYFDIIEAKAFVTSGIALIFAIFTCIFGIIDIVLITKQHRWKEIAKEISLQDVLVFLGMLVVVVSCALSKYKEEAIWGNCGFETGGLLLVLLGISYYFMSRNYKHNQNLWIILLVSSTIQFVLGLLVCFKIDPLGLHSSLDRTQYYSFVGTIGNVNWYAGFLSMVLSVLLFSFIHSSGKSKILYGIVLWLGTVNAFVAKSDSIIVSIGVLVLMLAHHCRKNKALFRNLCVALFVMLSSTWFLMLLKLVTGVRQIVRDEDALFFFLRPGNNILITLLLTAVMLFASNEKRCRIIFKILFGVFLIGVIAIGIFLVFNGITNEFGNGRGFIWREAVKLYAMGSPKDKIVGVGPECFGLALYDSLYPEVMSVWGAETFIANAHNEILQYFVTTGILGFIIYIGMFVINCIYFINDKADLTTKVASLAVVSYFGQALLNNPQALNATVLMLFISVAEACRKNKGGDRKKWKI